MIRIGINGFGRIGRTLFRLLINHPKIEVVLVNDLSDIDIMAYLLKYDSIHGSLNTPIEVKDNKIFIGNHSVEVSSFSNPEDIQWNKYNVDCVIESTGRFLDISSAKKHLKPGVRHVLLSAPSPSIEIPTIVYGVNDDTIDYSKVPIISNASCTTNAVSPLILGLRKLTTIQNAYVTTVHSYTNDQKLHDSPHKDYRRSRAGAESIIPTTTGAAKAVSKIFKELENKIGGCAIRVPVPNGSLIDIIITTSDVLSVEAINNTFNELSTNQLKGILMCTSDPIVSRDIIGSSASCVYDANLTSVIGNMVKVVGWYDNETGYSSRLIDLIMKCNTHG